MGASQLRKSLTVRGLAGLKPAAPGQRYVIMDSDAPGLGVRVTDKGYRSFVFAGRFPGSTFYTHREISPVDVISLLEAREKAREWRALIKQGIDPGVMEKERRVANLQKQENTLSAGAERWFADKVRAERGGAGVEREFRFFTRLWGKRPVTAITEDDVRSVIKAKKTTAPAMARNLLGHLKRFYTWVVDERCYGIDVSPCDRLKPSKIIGDKARGKRILSDNELFALWRNAGRLKYPHGPAYKILLLTALRLNEVADAQRPELDFQQNLWVIPAERMKGKEGTARDHAVPLTADALDVLRSLPIFRSGPYLFSTTSGKSPAWMTHGVKKRLDRRMVRTLRALARQRGDDPTATELLRWTNHDIRRTVRSHLSRLKVAEEAREAILAHVRPGIKSTYDHYDYLDEKREALELWAARLRSIVDPPAPNVVPLRATG